MQEWNDYPTLQMHPDMGRDAIALDLRLRVTVEHCSAWSHVTQGRQRQGFAFLAGETTDHKSLQIFSKE